MEIDGKEFVGADVARLAIVANDSELTYMRLKGMPCIKDGRRFLYCLDDCHAWHRGEYKKPTTAATEVS